MGSRDAAQASLGTRVNGGGDAVINPKEMGR